MAKTAEETIAEVRAIGERVHAMRMAAPPDDPNIGVCFKIEAFCGRVEAMIRSNDNPPSTREPGK